MKNLKSIPKLEQGDLLFVELTGSLTGSSRRGSTGSKGPGWLLVTEVATDGRIISANFCPQGQEGPHTGGYGQVIWPTYDAKAFLRGTHGECSPFAAMATMFNKPAAIALT